jgi:ketosteroid isomerase-like protein
MTVISSHFLVVGLRNIAPTRAAENQAHCFRRLRADARYASVIWQFTKQLTKVRQMKTTDASQHQANKTTVRRFFEIATNDGLPTALALLTDDATWWSTAGEQSKATMGAILPLLESHTVNGFRFECGTLTAEGDRVAAEARSFAELKNGKKYANQYHFLFTLRGGRIASVREHCDTMHVNAIWGDVF